MLSTYYMGIDKAQSDKYWEEQSRVAEMSRDRKLMVDVYMVNSQRYFNMANRQDNINTAIASAEKALALSKASNLNEYEAWSYLLLSRGAIINGKYDQALNHSNMAESIASGLTNDSLNVYSALQLGHVYLKKNEKMLAFRNYLRAVNRAEEVKNYNFQSTSYYYMSQFYATLDDSEKAKDYLYKNLALTYQYHKPYDRLNVYNLLGQVYGRGKNAQENMAIDFYERALALADTLDFELIKLNTYGSMMNTYLIKDKTREAVEFFDSKPELKKFIRQAGFEHFMHQTYGMAFAEAGRMDSAEYYLKLAETGMERNADIFSRHGFYTSMAYYNKLKKDYRTSLAYLLKAKSIADATGTIDLQARDAKKLDSIYQKLGDFKNAYIYNREYQQATDSLEKLTLEKELALAEVENENKRTERDRAMAAEATRDRHNIQYMGITAAIAAVFIVLVMLGIFSVSPGTIRIIGFFAFIFLFEFIILLADNKIHHWTHGEPWKVLLIKIGLISVLLPLHHFTEKKVVHYITSRKLFELNKDSFLSKFKKKENIAAD